MGYKNTVIKGIGWLGAIRLSTRALTIVKTIVIARILSPDQFGLFGIATLMLALIEILTETGINIFLVQQKEKVDQYISTAWIISIVRGVCISAMLLLFSSIVAGFFNAPHALPILYISSLIPFLRGFINPSVITFQKELFFKKEFIYRTTVFLVETISSMILVLVFPSPASLIYAIAIGVVYEIGFSFMVAKPRPGFSFDFKLFKKILSQGKWITLSTILNYVYQHGDDIAVGRLLGTASLGYYDMAYRISLIPITDIGDVIAKVTFPIYVKISHDKKRLKEAFFKSFILVVGIVVPIGIVLFVFPKEIVTLVLGEKWLPIVDVLRVLGIFGVVRSLSLFATTFFLSVQKQRIFSLVTFVGMAALCIIIVPFVNAWGIVGAGYAALIGTIATIPVVSYFLRREFRNT